jgi:hypothetical protein
MHIHLPKPLHGWREFLGEVGIIVVGILIALTAEQVVEAVHWHHVVEADSEALNDDVEDMWKGLSFRVVIQPCIDRKLGEIGTILARHDAGRPLDIVAPIGRPSNWIASTATLQLATADGAISHMPLARKRAYFDAYGSYNTFQPLATEERDSWRVLQGLGNPAVLSEADWRDIRRAYNDAVDSNLGMKTNLRFGNEGQWLQPYAQFGKRRLYRGMLVDPRIVRLCGRSLSQG